MLSSTKAPPPADVLGIFGITECDVKRIALVHGLTPADRHQPATAGLAVARVISWVHVFEPQWLDR